MYTDTVFTKVVSLGGNRCAQTFCGENNVKVIPLTSKALAANVLQEFVHDVGIRNELMVDRTAEQTGPNSYFIIACRKYDIRVFRTEPYTRRQNKAERIIGELQSAKALTQPHVHEKRPFAFVGPVLCMSVKLCLKWPGDMSFGQVLKYLRVTRPIFLSGSILNFMIWFGIGTARAMRTTHGLALGRWLGVAHRVGSNLCYWILTSAGKVVARTTVQHVTEIELLDPAIKKRVSDNEILIWHQLDDSHYIDHDIEDLSQSLEDIDLEDKQQDPMVLPEVTEEAFDKNVGTELFISSGRELIQVSERLARESGGHTGCESYLRYS
jgi:hypothetical protein